MSYITWYGVSAVQICTKGKYIVIDPYLRKCPLGFVDPATVKADFIMVTHGARDHFGDAVELTKLTGATLLAPADVITVAKAEGIPDKQLLTMLPGGQRSIDGIDFKAFHVQHISFTRYNDKVYTGVALAYMITLQEGIKLYHAGDTALHGDFKLFGDIYKPDIALMPVGMCPGGITELDPYESAIATDWLGVSYAIPVHFETETQSDYTEWYKKELNNRNPSIKVICLASGIMYYIGKSESGSIIIEKSNNIPK